MALLVALLSVLLQYCASSHFLSSSCVTARSLCAFLYVFVLALFLGSNASEVFLCWHAFSSRVRDCGQWIDRSILVSPSPSCFLPFEERFSSSHLSVYQCLRLGKVGSYCYRKGCTTQERAIRKDLRLLPQIRATSLPLTVEPCRRGTVRASHMCPTFRVNFVCLILVGTYSAIAPLRLCVTLLTG